MDDYESSSEHDQQFTQDTECSWSDDASDRELSLPANKNSTGNKNSTASTWST